MHVHDATETAYKNGYEAGYKAGKRDAVRREGKWIFDDFDSVGLDYQCSECRGWSRSPSNFCSFCGADMRKGKAIL